MATAPAHPTPAMPASRWPYLLAYLAAVVVAEVLISIPGGAGGQERPLQSIGLGIHILLVFTLMFLSVVIQSKDATLAPLLVAASLASLVRVFSLAVPRYNFLGLSPTSEFPIPETNPLNTIPWLALVSVPLLVSVAAVAYVQGLRPRDLVFVFAVALFYGVVVLVTRNLWGVILSHSLGNVILYLVAPFLFTLVR